MTLCRVGEDQDVDFAGRHGDRSYCVFVGLGDVMDLREREKMEEGWVLEEGRHVHGGRVGIGPIYSVGVLARYRITLFFGQEK